MAYGLYSKIQIGFYELNVFSLQWAHILSKSYIISPQRKTRKREGIQLLICPQSTLLQLLGIQVVLFSMLTKHGSPLWICGWLSLI